MPMHDVAATVPEFVSLGISFPQKGLFALLVELDLWIDRGMNEYPMLIKVDLGEIVYPLKETRELYCIDKCLYKI